MIPFFNLSECVFALLALSDVSGDAQDLGLSMDADRVGAYFDSKSAAVFAN
jgi:hypothetical protein